MGKGARMRQQRLNAKKGAKDLVYQEPINKAMKKEYNEQFVIAHDRYIKDEKSVILWVMHKTLGLGAKRLKKFWDDYDVEAKKLREHYAVSDDDLPWITRKLLKDDGIDFESWEETEE